MEFIREGDKILSNLNLFLMKLNFLDRETQYNNAIEKYISAMNKSKSLLNDRENENFKVYELAGKKLISCYEKFSNSTEMGKICISLGDKYFERNMYDEAIQYYRMAIRAFEVKYTNELISKTYEKLANVCNVTGDIGEEIRYFEMAIKFNMSENSKKYLLRYNLSYKYALNGEYQKAIDLIIETSSECIDNSVMKWNVTKNLFIAIILSLLLNSSEEASTLYEKCCNLDISFEGRLEGKTSRNIIEAYQNSDVEFFTDSIKEYDRISKFDNFHVSILSKLKGKLQDSGEDDLR